MALLNDDARRRGRRSRVVPAIVVLLPLAVAGCALLLGAEETVAFSHRIHVGDEELECSDCHRTAETADEPGMPTLRQCQLCHEEKDADKPPERRAGALFDAGGFRATRRSALGEEIVFSHRAHVAKVEDCGACHEGIATNDRIDMAIAVDMDECMACHTKVNAPNDCATCHARIRMDAAPHTHDGNWLRAHGKVVRARSEARVDQCTMCHTSEATCTACHQDTPPAGHDNYFRRRGHGVIARMDRESCAACHRTDSCDRCHSESRPLNHTGAWGSLRNTHCISCHLPLGSSECSVCHQGTPSHALAAPQPPSHTPGMNCRQCHGLTAPLPHVDSGDDCAACHR